VRLFRLWIKGQIRTYGTNGMWSVNFGGSDYVVESYEAAETKLIRWLESEYTEQQAEKEKP
jgi:hypothetical protein